MKNRRIEGSVRNLVKYFSLLLLFILCFNISYSFTMYGDDFNITFAEISDTESQLSDSDFNVTFNLVDKPVTIISGEYNVSIGYYYKYDMVIGPLVTLLSPSNATETNNNRTTFEFIPIDNNLDTCVLWHNSSGIFEANATNSTLTSGYINSISIYLEDSNEIIWNVICNDTDGNDISYAYNISLKVDTSPPNITIFSPNNNSGDKDGNLNFIYRIDDASNVTNCSLSFLNKINLTNISLTNNVNLSFTLNSLDIGRFNWNINCTDSLNNSAQTIERFLSVIKSITFGRDTTDFSQVIISSIPNLIITDNDYYGKINYSLSVDLSEGANLDTNVNISLNRIEVNTTAVSALNKSVILQLTNLTFSNPRILKDDSLCPSTICKKLSYTNGILTFNVTYLDIYSAEETPVDAIVVEESGGGGLGGGGGGSEFVPKYNFVTEPDIIKEILIQGQTTSINLIIENTGNLPLNLSVKHEGLNKFIAITEDNFKLQVGKTKTIRLDLYAPDEQQPDVYIGKIIIEDANVRKILNVILEVKKKYALFDIKVSLEEEYEILVPGDEIEASIIMYNLGPLKPVDVSLTYSIKDMEGNILKVEHETFAIDEQKLVMRKLKLPEEIVPGHHIFYARIDYENQTATSSELFKVIEKDSILKKVVEYHKNFIVLIVFFVVDLLLIFLLIEGVIYLIKKFKDKRNKLNKYLVTHVEKGYTFKQIKEHLISNGWDEKLLNEEYNKLKRNLKLKKYLSTHLKKGYKYETIKKHLIKNEWDKKILDQIYKKHFKKGKQTKV